VSISVGERETRRLMVFENNAVREIFGYGKEAT
jgi:hypothetical protein